MYLSLRTAAACSAVAASAALALFPTLSVRAAGGTGTAAAATASVIGGVAYDPSAPLDATVAPAFDPADPPRGAVTYRVRYHGAPGDSVPGLLTLPGGLSGGRRAPCILLLHGLGGSKADMVVLAAALARRGYASLAIDIASHGERPRIHGKTVDQLSVAELHDLAAVTAVDLRRAVDLLDTRPDIDANRLGFLGVSLGGVVGGLFAGDEPRVKAVALWAAGGNLGELLVTSRHPVAAAFCKTNHLGGPADSSRLEKALADVDPLSDIARIAPRPLLFLNGTDDNIVPRTCADALYRAAGEPKQRILLPGGHIPDATTMLLQSLSFFDARLKGGAS